MTLAGQSANTQRPRDSPAFPALRLHSIPQKPGHDKQQEQSRDRPLLHFVALRFGKLVRLATPARKVPVREDSFLLRQRKETQTGADSAELSALTAQHKISLTSGRSPFRARAVKRQ